MRDLKTFKISKVAIDARDLSYGMYDMILGVKGLDMVVTSVGYNNDYLMTGFLSPLEVITSVRTENPRELLEFHRLALRKPMFDGLLYSGVPTELNYQRTSAYGILYPEGVKTIEEWKELHGLYPEFAQIKLNPLNFDLDLVTYCEENGIKIIATDVFGEGTSLLPRWGETFLLGFASYWADIVAIPSRTYEGVVVNSSILRSYIGKEITTFDKKNFSLSRSSLGSTPVEPVPVRYIQVGGDIIKVEGSLSDYLNPTESFLSLSKNLESIEANPNATPIEEAVLGALRDSLTGITDISDCRAYARYISSGIIASLTGNSRFYSVEQFSVGDIFVTQVRHRVVRGKYWTFILSISQVGDAYRVYFRETVSPLKKKFGEKNRFVRWFDRKWFELRFFVKNAFRRR